jgi:hypothetical protein
MSGRLSSQSRDVFSANRKGGPNFLAYQQAQALKMLDALCFRKVSMVELIAALNFWLGAL